MTKECLNYPPLEKKATEYIIETIREAWTREGK